MKEKEVKLRYKYKLIIKESGEVLPQGVIIDVYQGKDFVESFTFWYQKREVR